MTEEPAPPTPALSFGRVAAAYDRARPSYPPEAVTWLVGEQPATVLELGAGTGKLTEQLVRQGHRVIATDPLPEMLARLRERVTPHSVGVSGAEAIPASDRSVDVVVCAQSFHWFDHERALPEIARVLRPGGQLSLVWNLRDEGIPWVRRLGALIAGESTHDSVSVLEDHALFGPVEHTRFRSWQDLDREGLLDLVRSRSGVATSAPDRREALLEKVGALYDEYGRGHDGMRLPYLTHCFRSVVRHPPQPAPAPDVASAAGTETRPTPTEPPEDPGTLLIDFR